MSFIDFFKEDDWSSDSLLFINCPKSDPFINFRELFSSKLSIWVIFIDAFLLWSILPKSFSVDSYLSVSIFIYFLFFDPTVYFYFRTSITFFKMIGESEIDSSYSSFLEDSFVLFPFLFPFMWNFGLSLFISKNYEVSIFFVLRKVFVMDYWSRNYFISSLDSGLLLKFKGRHGWTLIPFLIALTYFSWLYF